MPNPRSTARDAVPRADSVDARLLSALADDAAATTMGLAQQIGMSRNTVHARLARWEKAGALTSFERRVSTEFLGYPLRAYILTNVKQRRLTDVADALALIPEVIETVGLSGVADLLIQVVAVDADDLYRVAGQILAIDGVKRTNTALVMHNLVDYRLTPLIERLT